MTIGVLKDDRAGENRIALLPDSVKSLSQKGARICVESGLGEHLHITDDQYQQSGGETVDRSEIYNQADIILRVRSPEIKEIAEFKDHAVYISFLDPFRQKDLVRAFQDKKISALSLEMIPRSTIAQKMDAISSQANLAGYYAVILAAERIHKILPMMMTPAGTIAPARVFVIGAGVAGLQAIATAKRLGARVEAFDTRPVVAEQVLSLGAKFIEIDLGETGQTEQGYARQLTPEQLEKQRQAMADICSHSDIVITTAQVFGREAPRIISKDMIAGMAAGSVIVDMAVESGGNVEGSEAGHEVDHNGVRVLGLNNLPGHVALSASQMLSNNMANLIAHFWDDADKVFRLDREDDFFRSCLLTHQGEMINERIKELLS
ncbi:MAG: NAD(P) transhydrogenase subunit alpha [Candidatus Omnitrophota bacterium]